MKLSCHKPRNTEKLRERFETDVPSDPQERINLKRHFDFRRLAFRIVKE